MQPRIGSISESNKPRIEIKSLCQEVCKDSDQILETLINEGWEVLGAPGYTSVTVPNASAPGWRIKHYEIIKLWRQVEQQPNDPLKAATTNYSSTVERISTASPPTPLRAERGDKQGGFVKKGKRMAVQEYGNGVMIDRSRVTHGEMNRATVMRIEAQRAERDLDAEKVAQILTELDKLVMKVIVSVPLGWLPEGVTLDDPDWISKVSAERYEELTKLANGPQPGEKKA